MLVSQFIKFVHTDRMIHLPFYQREIANTHCNNQISNTKARKVNSPNIYCKNSNFIKYLLDPEIGPNRPIKGTLLAHLYKFNTVQTM